MTASPPAILYRWSWRTRLPGRYGQLCRVGMTTLSQESPDAE